MGPNSAHIAGSQEQSSTGDEVSRAARGAGWAIGAIILVRALAVLIQGFFARQLAPDDFGAFAGLFAFSQIVGFAGTLGLMPVFPRLVATAGAAIHKLVLRSFGMSLGVSLLFVAASYLWGPTLAGLSGTPQTSSLFVLAALTGTAGAVVNQCIGLFQALEEYRILFFRNAIGLGLSLLGLFALGRDAALDQAVLLCLALQWANVLLFVLPLYKAISRRRKQALLQEGNSREIFRAILPAFIGGSVVVPLPWLANVLLSRYSGPEEAGRFAVAFTLAQAGTLVLTTGLQTLLPVYARHVATRGAKGLGFLAASHLRLSSLLSLAAWLFGALLGPLGLYLLFGAAYASTSIPLSLLLLATWDLGAGGIVVHVFTALGHLKVGALSNVIFSAICALGLVLGAPFGAAGAAAGMGAGYVAHLLLVLWIGRRWYSLRGTVWRGIPLSMTLAALLVASSEFALWTRFVAFAAALAWGVYALKHLVRDEDRPLLLALLRLDRRKTKTAHKADLVEGSLK